MPDSSPSIISQQHREIASLKRDRAALEQAIRVWQSTSDDALARLFRSSASLYQRFGIYPPNTDDQMRVFFEEAGEFARAIFASESAPDATKEAVDVLVTMFGAMMGRGIQIEHVMIALETVIAKNDAKTTETHGLNAAGKIARKVRVK